METPVKFISNTRRPFDSWFSDEYRPAAAPGGGLRG
jgi:hypothetical protein